MKAKELMIGDWVLVNRSECVADGGHYFEWIEVGRIMRLEDGIITVRYSDHKEADTIDWAEESEEDIEPIHITPEILEKNGFKMKQKEGESNYEYVAAGGNYIIVFLFFRETIYGISTVMVCELGFSGGLDRIHKCNVKYVHELQHALRLCGIEKEIVL